MSTANETQVGGTHYKTAIQHWDMVAANGLGYFEGQVSKYVTRWRKKNGLQDLEKAHHFLTKLIEVVTQHGIDAHMAAQGLSIYVRAWPKVAMDAYADSNGLDAREASVCEIMATWDGHVVRLEQALMLVEYLIAEAEGSAPGAGYVSQ